MQIFDVIIFFELRAIQQKTVKPTYLCPLGARKLAEGFSFIWVFSLINTENITREQRGFLEPSDTILIKAELDFGSF